MTLGHVKYCKGWGMNIAICMQIIWCEEFHYWVLWFHLDLPSFGFPAVGVARSETLQGPFEFVKV